MADNFNISEWKFNQLLKEGFDEQAHELVLDTTEQIKKEFNSLPEEAQEYYAKTLVDNLNQIFQFILESKKKVEEELDPEDEVIELSDKDFRTIIDRVESSIPYDENEDAFYDEDGQVFSEIAKYAMNDVPANKAFYLSLQDVIDGFDEILDQRLVITGEDAESLNKKHEFVGDFGYTYGSLDESEIDDRFLSEIELKEEMDYENLSEKKKEKADRCLRIARRKNPKSSAYRSGLIVQCRNGKIWKDLKG